MLKRKYFKETEEEVKRAREVATKQYERQMNGEVDNYDDMISFAYYDIEITNPFLDDTGRFEFSLDEAYDHYGIECMNQFIDRCNE